METVVNKDGMALREGKKVRVVIDSHMRDLFRRGLGT